MKRPWQIWTLYILCLAVAIPAMGWLSVKIVELDQQQREDRVQTELARREAEMQERISSALWRMDWLLTPHIAQEAARPYYLYEPFYQVIPQPATPSVKGQPAPNPVSTELPSPILYQPSDFVLLHFQVGPKNEITSPQRPEGESCVQAMTCCGLTQPMIDRNDSMLDSVRDFVDYETILLACPSTKLPSAQQRTELVAANSSPAQQAEVPSQQAQLSQGFDNELATTTYLPQIEQIQQQADVFAEQQQGKPIKGQTDEAKSKTQQLRNLARGNAEWLQRRKSAEEYALNQWTVNNRLGEFIPVEALASSTLLVREGIMRPMWIEDKLILARRVERNNEEVLQCCWLDWEEIRNALQLEVQDLLPEVNFEPIQTPDDLKLGRALATLPVQLVVNSEELMASLDLSTVDSTKDRSPSGLGMSLVFAWCALVFAAISGAVLLHGVIRLSERRGAFVSAVTHELRTPLTTFRMYAEMLAEKMVPSPEKQNEYARTLKAEAERLSHLVENVLQFARLERGAGSQDRHERIEAGQLFARFSDRLQERAEQAGMKLVLPSKDSEAFKREINTDPAAIEQILFNLVDNACKYAKSAKNKQIEIDLSFDGSSGRFRVRDYGPGVSEEGRKRLFQPFRKSDQDAANSAPGVGLGLALCRRMAKSLGGKLYLEQDDSSFTGATFVLEFPV